MSWDLALLILLTGAITLGLLALIAAAVITALKGRLDLFGWGFLTFGATWFGGALLLAPADSAWARRRYSEEQRERAELTFSYQRSRRTFAAWGAVGLALVVLLGSFVLRPSPLLGVDGTALGSSVPNRGDFLLDSLPPCEQRGGNHWTCSVYSPGFSSTIEYDVRVGELGCWRAVPAERWSGAEEYSGCVSFLNYLWP